MKLIGIIDEVQVWEVDGDAVRDTEVEFARGGNPGRYPDLIPAYQVWVEKKLSPRDQAAVIVRHFVEYCLHGDGAERDDADTGAALVEVEFRKEVTELKSGPVDMALLFLEAHDLL